MPEMFPFTVIVHGPQFVGVVHDWEPSSFTSVLIVPETKKSGLAIPPDPMLSVFVPLPFWMVTLWPEVKLKMRPRTDWLPFRFTNCGLKTVLALKVAVSSGPGGAAGSGVVALLDVDQELAVFQPVPLPSQ